MATASYTTFAQENLTDGLDKQVEAVQASSHSATQAAAEHGTGNPQAMTPDLYMIGVTLCVFLLLVGILKKYAWGPIMLGLDEREAKIRKSLDDAQAAAAALAQAQNEAKALVAEAKTESAKILHLARESATQNAQAIEAKARAEAQISLDNVRREIESARHNVMIELRRESAELAVELAGKILGETISTEKGRELTTKLIGKI